MRPDTASNCRIRLAGEEKQEVLEMRFRRTRSLLAALALAGALAGVLGSPYAASGAGNDANVAAICWGDRC